MGLQKGQTNNLNGRPKGSKNKVTGDVKKFVQDILSKNCAQIQKDLQEVDAPTRLKFFVSLLPYVIPKQNQTNITSYDHLTDEQVDEIINEITQNVD